MNDLLRSIAETPFIEWLKLAATVLLALIAAGIAVRQTMIARQKFRLDLFEKREPIFQAVWAACSAYVVQVDPSEAFKTAEDMKNLAPQARFLFGGEIYDYILEARNFMIVMDSFHQRRAKNINETHESTLKIQHAEAWLAHEADEGCKERFGAYLDFSHWT